MTIGTVRRATVWAAAGLVLTGSVAAHYAETRTGTRDGAARLVAAWVSGNPEPSAARCLTVWPDDPVPPLRAAHRTGVHAPGLEARGVADQLLVDYAGTTRAGQGIRLELTVATDPDPTCVSGIHVTMTGH